LGLWRGRTAKGREEIKEEEQAWREERKRNSRKFELEGEWYVSVEDRGETDGRKEKKERQ
jgi:hypothetical protein